MVLDVFVHFVDVPCLGLEFCWGVLFIPPWFSLIEGVDLGGFDLEKRLVDLGVALVFG